MKNLKVFLQVVMIVISTSIFASDTKTQFLDGKFEILQPEGWELMENLNDVASLQMADASKEAYMVIISEPMSDFDSGYTVQKHSEVTRNTFIGNILDGKLVSGPRNIKINGMDGVECGISGRIEDIEVLYSHIAIKSSKHYHQVLFWSTKAGFKSNKPAFDKILNSITEIKTADKKITFLDSGYEILQPADWELMDNLNENAALQMGDPSNEAYMIIISESINDFEEGFTIEKHSEITRNGLLENVQEAKIISGPKKIKVGNMDGIQFELSGTVQNIDVVYYHVTLKSSNHFHQVLAWTTTTRYKTNRNIFEKITKSMKEL